MAYFCCCRNRCGTQFSFHIELHLCMSAVNLAHCLQQGIVCTNLSLPFHVNMKLQDEALLERRGIILKHCLRMIFEYKKLSLATIYDCQKQLDLVEYL